MYNLSLLIWLKGLLSGQKSVSVFLKNLTFYHLSAKTEMFFASYPSLMPLETSGIGSASAQERLISPKLKSLINRTGTLITAIGISLGLASCDKETPVPDEPNQTPILTINAQPVSENLPAGTIVANFTSNDPDGSIIGVRLTKGGENFALNGQSQVIATRPFNYETDGSLLSFTLEIEDDEGAIKLANQQISIENVLEETVVIETVDNYVTERLFVTENDAEGLPFKAGRVNLERTYTDEDKSELVSETVLDVLEEDYSQAVKDYVAAYETSPGLAVTQLAENVEKFAHEVDGLSPVIVGSPSFDNGLTVNSTSQFIRVGDRNDDPNDIGLGRTAGLTSGAVIDELNTDNPIFKDWNLGGSGFYQSDVPIALEVRDLLGKNLLKAGALADETDRRMALWATGGYTADQVKAMQPED